MKARIIIIPLLVLIVAFAIIDFFAIRGNYTINLYFIPDAAKDLNNVHIVCDNEGIIEVIETEYIEKNESLSIKLKPLKEGKTSLKIYFEDENLGEYIYDFKVNKYLFVIEDGFIGSLENIYIIRVQILIILLLMSLIIVLIIHHLIHSEKYSYKLMFYWGTFIFTLVNLFLWIIEIVHKDELNDDYLYDLYGDIIHVFSRFALAVFPYMIILALFLSISNIILIKKEGRSITNTLGILLGFFLTAMTVIGFISYNVLEKVLSVNSYIGYHVSLFVESSIFCILGYFECMMLGTLICTILSQNHVPKFDKDYLIILGCSIREDGTPTPLLKGRIDRAIWFAKKQKEKTGKDITFIASGGQGSDEIISEAESIRNYLVDQGIPKEQIIMEDKSTSTYENMKFSNKIITNENPEAKIAFSTNGYHVFRSGNIAINQNIDSEGIGSKTKWYFYTNALIREFVANINASKKRHIANIVSIILWVGILLIISYFFNIL